MTMYWILLGVMIAGMIAGPVAAMSPRVSKERTTVALKVQSVGNAVTQIAGVGVISTFFVPELISGNWSLLFPLILFPVLVVVVVLQAVQVLRKSTEELTSRRPFDPKPVSTISMVYLVLISVLGVYLVAWTIGRFANMALGAPASWMEPVLPWVGVAVVVGFLPAILSLWRKTIARRQQVAAGHPMSDEVAVHAIAQAQQRILGMLRGGLRYARGVYVATGTFALFAVLVLIIGVLTAQGAPEDGNVFGHVPAWFAIVAIVGASLAVLFGIVQGARGVLAEMQGDYVFAALTPAQREEAYVGLFRSPEAHRFPHRITNPERTIRVLSIHRDATIELEHVAADVLIDEHSAPLEEVNAVEHESEGDEESEAHEPPTPEEEQFDRVMDRVIDRLTHGSARPNVESYDIFWSDDNASIHIVATGATDYLHFPEDLAQELQNTI